MRFAAVTASVIGVLLAGAPSSIHAQTWGANGVRIHRLPSPFQLHTFGGGIVNNFGQVAGTFGLQGGFIGLDGTFSPIASLGGHATSGSKINNLGVVAGSADDPTLRDRVPVIYENGVTESLGMPANGTFARATAINDHGQVVGSAFVPGGLSSFFYSNGVMQTVPTLGGASAELYDINNSGVAVGRSTVIDGELSQALMYSNGTSVNLGSLGSGNSTASAINNDGVIVGRSTVETSSSERAFVYRNGSMVEINDITQSFGSIANDISDTWHIVGNMTTGMLGMVGALWEMNAAGGWQSYSLTDIVNAHVEENWFFYDAVGISDNGRYVVAMASTQGFFGYTLLEAELADTEVPPEPTVTPEPISMLLMGTGLAGIGAAHRRRRKKTGSAE